MSSQLQHEQVAAGLFTWWNDNFPLSVATVYPGMRIDTNDLSEWLEMWIDTWSRRPQRPSPEWMDIAIAVHCFVRPSTDKSRILELVNATCSTLSQQTVPIQDFELSGLPVVGYTMLFEAESRDLTRNHLNRLQHPLQHYVVSLRGIAQQTT